MTQTRDNTAVVGLLLVFTGAILWGTAGPASQFLYDGTDTSPMAVALLRIALAAPLLLLVAAPALRRHWQDLWSRAGTVLIGGICIALYQTFYFQAVAVSGVTLATLTALCPVPVLVALLARVVLGERERPIPWVGIIAASAGTLLLVGTPETSAPVSQLALGAALGLMASLAFSGIALTGRALGDTVPPLAVTAAFFTVGAVALSPVVLAVPQGLVAAFHSAWMVAFLVLVPTVVAYSLFYSGVGRTPAAITGVLIVAEPLTAATLGWALFDERLSAMQLAGAALLCTAMIKAALER
ncbi:DMT family transporter [Aquisalimonas asiatica]|uniref:Drug/metabolite transporter, DME family n=1 Tax=Aquisalimonas asiatica TaxID=406100 RepID=A0A1H8QMB1_9GAMM|nr:EamA family transporter [Aquisalimonas asiatica]SEO55067.1 drug/metabolite transporter, DME family [Aquisalimonas asiatica]